MNYKKICSALTACMLAASITSANVFAVSEHSFRYGEQITDMGDTVIEDVSAADSGTVGDITWELSEDGTLTVTGEGELTRASWNKRKIVNAIIGEGITALPSRAFDGATKMVSVSLPSTLEAIPTSAFLNCRLLTEIDIPDNVSEIGVGAFRGCTSLASVDIPDNVSEIGESAFNGCDSLKSIVIPEGVTVINERTFFNCTVLESVTLPSTIRKIGNISFMGCLALKSIDLPDGLTEIGVSAFSSCRVLEEIKFPDSLETIGRNAFSNTALKSIHIPSKVSLVAPGAFSGCQSLTELTVATDNQKYCAVGNQLLSKDKTFLVCVPAGVTAKEYTVPSYVTGINYGCFSTDLSLEKVNIHKNVSAIAGADGDSVNSEESNAFRYCFSLKEINVDSANPLFSTYKGALYHGNATTLLSYPYAVTEFVLDPRCRVIGAEAAAENEKLTSVSIPAGITAVNMYAFSSCYNLKTVRFLGDEEVFIGEGAFEYCMVLEEVYLPEKLIGIPDYMFDYCYALKAIDIPETVTYIGDYAFCGTAITELYLPESVTDIGWGFVDECEQLKALYVPPSLTLTADKMNWYVYSDLLTVYCMKDSSAHEFAVEYEIPYVLLDGSPMNVKAAAADKSVTVSWYKPYGSTKYAVYIDKGDGFTCLSSKITDDSFTVTGLTNDTEYKFMVKAYVDGKWSAASSTVSATPKGVVTVPQNVRATAGNAQVTIAWDKLDGATKYAVYLYDGKYTCLTSDITGTSYIAGSLTNGTKYGFKVKAYINGAWGAASDIVYATPTVGDIVPKNVKATAGDTKATVTWDKVDGATKYAVYKYIDGKYTCLTTAVTGTSYTVTGLENGTKYGFKVKAYVDQWSGASAMAYATPVSANIVPQSVKAKAGNGQATITWSAVSGATKYAVYIYKDGKYTCLNSNIKTTSYTATGLENGVKVGFKVKAYAGKWSGASAMAYATPTDGNIIPQNVKATGGDTTAAITWNAVAGAERYAVYIYKDGKYTCLKSNITGTSYTATGLTNGTKVGFKVKAYINGAWSGASAMAYATPNA